MDNHTQPSDDQYSLPDHFLLQQAIELMQAKRLHEARPLLMQYLRLNPNSEKGWFLLSYAVAEPERKADCLRRVLELNPTHWRAQERLEPLKTSPKNVNARKPKRKRGGFPIWATAGLFTILGIVVVAVGIFGFRILRDAPRPEPLAAAQDTSTPSPAPQASRATPTSTATITPTPSPPAPATQVQQNPQVAAQMDTIQNQVAELRGLEALSSVPRTMLEEGQVQPFLEGLYLERNTKDAVADQARVLSALGLIDPTYDLYSKTIHQLGEGLGGFYVPWTDELFVIGNQFSGIERLVFAHEYDHALVDQHFALEAIGVYPECLTDMDRCLAITALIEGDATYLMYAWLDVYGTDEDVNDILEAQYTPTDRVISSTHLPPLYLVRETQFRYEDGYHFVQYLIERGKWQMVDLAYGRFPTTSEQILHPEKFQAGEMAKPVETPDLQAILGDDWRMLAFDTLGELGTELILGYGANYLANVEPHIAKEAAKGWGGDNYQMYYKSTTNQKVLVVNWVGDSWTDTYEFTEALEARLNIHYRGNTVEHDTGACWELLNDHYACVFKTKYKALWISAPSMEILEQVHALYPDFP